MGLTHSGSKTEEAAGPAWGPQEPQCIPLLSSCRGHTSFSSLGLCQLGRSDIGAPRDLPPVPRHEVIAPGPMTSLWKRAKQVCGGGAESRAPGAVGPDVLSFSLGLICSGFVEMCVYVRACVHVHVGTHAELGWVL